MIYHSPQFPYQNNAIDSGSPDFSNYPLFQSAADSLLFFYDKKSFPEDIRRSIFEKKEWDAWYTNTLWIVSLFIIVVIAEKKIDNNGQFFKCFARNPESTSDDKIWSLNLKPSKLK